MKVLTSIVIDTRKALKTGKYPVKLRVTYNRKQKYFQTKLNLTEAEFEHIYGKHPKGQFKKWRMKLDALELTANKIIENQPFFDFTTFSRKFAGNKPAENDAYGYYMNIIDSLNAKEKFGTASTYTSGLQSLKRFKTKLQFNEISVDFLESYEHWLLKQGKSVSTVGIYLRPLRAVLNRAIAEEIISKDYNYPFGAKSKFKYQIPTSKNIKKALTLAEIKKLFQYQPEKGTWEEKALDFWIFSYLANGMNMKDISLLRYKDINGEYIHFVRSKTINTNNVASPISIFITEHIKKIIDKWGNPERKPDNLIFPIVYVNDSLKKQRSVLQQFIKMVNKYMRRIAQTLEIDKPVTTYYARHSFSTVLKRSGANVMFISEALGHSSITTTKAYLDGFEDETKKEMAKALTAFD